MPPNHPVFPHFHLQAFMSKIVLGNDFSGGTNGDSPALTISLAITNLASATFGQLYRLQVAGRNARWLV